jgi:hypothetical protein
VDRRSQEERQTDRNLIWIKLRIFKEGFLVGGGLIFAGLILEIIKKVINI